MGNDVRFSPQQTEAIYTEGNIIVSAGAGSGKTTVMIERIIRKLIEGVPLESMLIVTFTNASAADLKYKLAEKLAALSKSPDPRERKAGLSARDALPVCMIGTLHGFCRRLIKTYFYAAGVDPSAAIMDDGDSKKFKTAAISAAIRHFREEKSGAFAELYTALSSRRGDGGLIKSVESVLDYALSLSDTRGYLERSDGDDRAERLEAALRKNRDELVRRIEELTGELRRIGFVKLLPSACDLIPYIDGKIDGVTAFRHTAKNDERDGAYEAFKVLKEDCKKYVANVAAFEAAKKVDHAPYVRALSEVALDALDRYEKKKAALGKIDYSDLEHGADRVLSDPGCVAEISKTLKAAFIDEFQDVNPLQASIADRLKAAGAEMFLVGDIKQSIYGFRRCDPKFFAGLLEENSGYRAIYLNDNFRSAPNVVDFINVVFDGVMKKNFGGVDYTKKELVCGAKNIGEGKAGFFVVPASGTQRGKNENTYSVISAAERAKDTVDPQVTFILNTIADYLRDNPEDANDETVDRKNKDKKRSPSDIAVLVRSARTPFCDALVRELRKSGTAVKLGRKSSIGDYPEVMLLVEILRCIDNRFDDVALYSALRSPMGGFSDEELFEIAQSGPDRRMPFWQKVEMYDGRLNERLDAFKSKREEFLRYACFHDAADAIGNVTSSIGFFQYVFETGGDARAVEEFISLAAAKKGDLSAFLSDADEFAELDTGGGGDAITVTTVHASKGLEYDLVIVADVARSFNLRDASMRVIPGECGIALKVPDKSKKKLVPSAAWLYENAFMPSKMREEELRLFYVALTRAKRYLVVCGRDAKRNAVEQSRRELDFMKNIGARIADCEARTPNTVESRIPPVNAAIENAIVERCEKSSYAPSDVPLKTCVTAIAEKTENAEDNTESAEVMYPDDDRTACGKLGGEESRLRGTAYHKAMELIDFGDPDFEKIKEKTENVELVDEAKIIKAAKAMKELTEGATAVMKERYFITGTPAEKAREVGTLVQGVIDLLILYEGGTAAIVDYKTTAKKYILRGDVMIHEGYKKQLEEYKKAVERAMKGKIKVVKKFIYSFDAERLIECV